MSGLLDSFLETTKLDFVYRNYLVPSYSEEFERRFVEHCRSVGRPIFRGLIYWILMVALLTWPLDYWLYHSDGRITWAVNVWHGSSATVCAILLWLDFSTDLTREYFSELLLAGFMVISVAIFYSMGSIGGLGEPWFYSIYGLPFISLILFNLNFYKRFVFTLGLSITSVVAYFGFHPGYLNHPYLETPLFIGGIYLACSILVGHVIHNLYKRYYIQTQRLEESVREKETLLEEIHHRVKNNMQVISSMLNMHARRNGDEEFEEVSQEVVNRVKSMALIHETLYRSEHLREVNLPEYVNDLCNHLLESYPKKKDPELTVDVADANIGMDQAIACGLIINESVYNALEHGIDGNPDDRIEVSLNEVEETGMVLKISDNGRGLENGFKPDDSSSTGMFLIQSLAGYELNGTVDFLEQDGFTVSVRFSTD